MGISLANKCQLLFGCAVLLILGAALSVPWFHTPRIVREGQLVAARQLADAWLANIVRLGAIIYQDEIPERRNILFEDPAAAPGLRLLLIDVNEIAAMSPPDPFLTTAARHFSEDAQRREHIATVTIEGETVYRYARAIRQSHVDRLPDEAARIFGRAPDGGTPSHLPQHLPGALRALLIVDRTDPGAQSQLLRSQILIIAAGLAAGLLAVLVFYLILTKLILSPVRTLRETAEKVQQGDLAIRADIQTGDEFQQLSETFNAMLDQVEQSQQKLRSMNESLDLKLTELSEANIGLYESNRLKSEFLANVSHELKTPLNSIIGFAELLHELATTDENADPKRARYLSHILSSSRSLLEMINELLQMARIEAGRVEVNVEPASVADLIEGLTVIMKPQAEAKNIELRTKVAGNVPVIETDPGKLQQILFNFLSNAVKFTPNGGVVTISADRVKRQDNSVGVRLAVADTGPGIPYDMQETIFEKFRQIDASHTRQHTGTGLGLAICRELAELLGASVSLVSEPGRGATFFVDLPLTYQPDFSRPLMDERMARPATAK